MTAPSLLDELEGVVPDDLGCMNSALCDFAMRWEIDGDYMRCRKCKRPQITSYASHDFPHADGCKAAGTAEAHPWETFIRLLQPLIRDHAEIAAMAKRLEAAERDAARYRGLRDALYQENIAVGEAELVLRVYGSCPSIEQFDAAIDASTQEGEG